MLRPIRCAHVTAASPGTLRPGRDTSGHGTAQFGTGAAALVLWLAAVLSLMGCREGVGVLAQGRHDLVQLVREVDDRVYLVSIRDPGPRGGTLQIIPLDRPNEPCDAGWVSGPVTVQGVAYEPTAYLDDAITIGDGHPVQVSVARVRSNPRARDIWYVDMECRRNGLALEGVVEMASAGNGNLFARTEAHELWHLNPLVDEQRLLAARVTMLEPRAYFGSVWSIEDGQVVERTRSGGEFRRFGTEVTEMVFELGDDGGTYFTDPDGVHWMAEGGTEPTMVEPGGCRPALAGGRILYSNAPCEERGLVARDLVTGEQWTFALNDATLLMVQRALTRDGPPGALYATGHVPERDAGEDLPGAIRNIGLDAVWYAAAPGEELFVANDVRQITLVALGEQGAEWLVIHDGEDERGIVSLWSPGRGTRRLSGGGAWYLLGWLLHRLDDGVGALAQFDSTELSLQTVAAGVPLGVPRLLNYPFGGLGYLRDFDTASGAGILEVRLRWPDRVMRLHERVRQFMTLHGPQSGLLLAALGDDGSDVVFFDRRAFDGL
jgi:hypothetical protein